MTDLDIKHLFEILLDRMKIHSSIPYACSYRTEEQKEMLEKEKYIRSYLEKIKEGE